MKSLATSLTNNHALGTLLLRGKLEVIHGGGLSILGFGGLFFWGGISGLVWFQDWVTYVAKRVSKTPVDIPLNPNLRELLLALSKAHILVASWD